MIAETLYNVVHGAPRRPGEQGELPPEIDLVLAIGLAKRQADRFGSAVELADALADAFAGTLPDAIRQRGTKLVHAGAWASTPAAPRRFVRPHG